jgi:hypothetical protein
MHSVGQGVLCMATKTKRSARILRIRGASTETLAIEITAIIITTTTMLTTMTRTTRRDRSQRWPG